MPIICQDVDEEYSLLYYLEDTFTRSLSLPTSFSLAGLGLHSQQGPLISFTLHCSEQLEADISPIKSQFYCIQ